jgi:hypothetical protein
MSLALIRLRPCLRPRTKPTRFLLQLQRQFSTTRPIMSTQFEYLVSIPDHANSLSKRLAARPAHLANLKPHIESGKVVFGGATLSKQPGEGEAAEMTVCV